VGLNQVETDIYLIENPAQLNRNYKIYQVRGLSPDSEDYDKNAQFLETTLRRKTESPCVVFKKDDNTYVAQPEGFVELPSSLDLVRTAVKIEKMPQLEELKFDSLNPVTAKLALEFLQWSIQSKFYNNPWLWQPRAGYPFYNKSPDQEFRRFSNDVDLLRGFTFRVVLLPDRRIGVCIDVSSKYVSRRPLPTTIDRKDFNNKFQGLNCLYEYGNRWYEIRIEGLSDFDVSSLTLPPNDVSLFDDIHQKAGSYRSPNLLALPKDCSVLIYYTTFREPRHAPSGLCRLTYTTDHPQVKQFHSRTIKPPHARRKEIQFVVERNFRDLTFGSSKIILSEKPRTVDERRFIVPDLEFGKGKILSVRNAQNAVPSSLDEFGFKKRDLMYSNEAGLFVKKPFDRQYLILPKSVYGSFGKKFIEDIKNEVQRLYAIDDKIVYAPTIVTYNDSVQKTVPAFGRVIINAVEENNVGSGFGLVMIPEIRSKRFRKEDELANLVMRELRERDFFVSIIHDTVPMESYEYTASENEDERWRVVSDHKQQGVYKGYLRNVVLNKILILNWCWPFVLKTPLNADLVIGVDIKNKCAGFTAIHKNGADITFYPSESDQKERLSKNHICTKIVEIITNEQKLSGRSIRKIVFHRQGKLFSPEKDGITQALNRLANDDVIPKDYEYTLVEVKTTSRVPFRLFYVTVLSGDQKEMVYNPWIGTFVLLSESESFVCNTGPPFEHRGTTKPLHVVKIEGSMSLEKVVEDVFYLSNLTWTKIDDCSRQPLSVKMNDIRLREIAGEYDRDALRFVEEEE
jgi:hypothetical protein